MRDITPQGAAMKQLPYRPLKVLRFLGPDSGGGDEAVVNAVADLLRKQFDATVAFNSKQGEAMLKLVGEAAAPVKGRVSLAVEAIKKVA